MPWWPATRPRTLPGSGDRSRADYPSALVDPIVVAVFIAIIAAVLAAVIVPVVWFFIVAMNDDEG